MADQKLTGRDRLTDTNSLDDIHVVRYNESFKMRSSLLSNSVTTDIITGNAVLEGDISYTGTGLDYYVWVNGCIIDSTVYEDLVTDTKTLSDGDATHGRIDVFAIQVNANSRPATFEIVVVEGTPSSTPLKPSLDLTNQAEIGFRLVPALETVDSTTTVNQIYDENIEWTNTTLTTGGDLNDTTNPYTGVKNFETPATALDSVSWTDSGLTTFNPNDSLFFALRTVFSKNTQIRIKLINSSSSNYWLKTIKAGQFSKHGVDEEKVDWQPTQLRLSEFQPKTITQTQYDRIEFTLINTAILGLDRIEIQGDLEQTDGGVKWTDLIDTPNNYNGKAGLVSTVKSDETGMELVASSGGAFEVIDEGSGDGIVKAGRTAANYGNVGAFGTDLSTSLTSSSTRGATGTYALAANIHNTASGTASTAIGQNNTASGDSSLAMGNSSIASGDSSFAGGQTGSEAKGDSSFSYGDDAMAESFAEFTVGMNSTDYTPNSTTAHDPDDRAFSVANGVSSGSKSEALIILKSGHSEFFGTVKFKGYTVATLPTGEVGMQAYVTDATAPTYLATVSGGGAVTVKVFFDGTNWIT